MHKLLLYQAVPISLVWANTGSLISILTSINAQLAHSTSHIVNLSQCVCVWGGGYIMASVGLKRPQQSSRDLKRSCRVRDRVDAEAVIIAGGYVRGQMVSTDHRVRVNADMTQVLACKDTIDL